MPTLRLRQISVAESRHRVEVEMEGQTAVSEFSFSLSPQQQEDLRWYLEDFLNYPLDPAPKIAARVEGDLARIGEQLFAEVFRTDDARDMWATLRAQSSAVNDLAVAHNQLGVIYRNAGDIDQALHNWRQAIRYFEAVGDAYRAAVTQNNVALALARAGRLSDALEYAQAALCNFETFGARAQAELQDTYKPIKLIHARLPAAQP